MKDWSYNPAAKTIKFPGDPAYRALASADIHGELVIVYEHAWVCIVQPNGEFAVTRMD
jgi:hypothetical protein